MFFNKEPAKILAVFHTYHNTVIDKYKDCVDAKNYIENEYDFKFSVYYASSQDNLQFDELTKTLTVKNNKHQLNTVSYKGCVKTELIESKVIYSDYGILNDTKIKEIKHICYPYFNGRALFAVENYNFNKQYFEFTECSYLINYSDITNVKVSINKPNKNYYLNWEL